MKLKFYCIACESAKDEIDLPMNNTNVYEFTCKYGHKNRVYIKEPMYELLFDSGCAAFNDGYIKESVSSIQSSLESFYDYCIQFCFIKKYGNLDLYHATTKENRFSERRYGSYYSLLTFLIGKTIPRVDEKKITNFRNNVIHNDKIPTKQEAKMYIQSVYEYILNIKKIAFTERDNYKMEDFYWLDHQSKNGLEDNDMHVQILKQPTIFELSKHVNCFDNCISEWSSLNKIIYQKA